MSAPSSSKKVIIDEDVDDLDDVLDDFTAPPPPPAPRPAPPSAAPAAQLPADDDEFTKELAEGMDALMRELSGAAGAAPSGPGAAAPQTQTAEERQRTEAFAAAWETLLAEGMDANVGVGTTAPAPDASAEDAFARTIREAMERMQTSESNLRADAAADTDPLAALLASLGGEGGGEGGDGDLSGMLEGMMGQLMTKTVLYEPLKELDDKFPDYMKEHDKTLSAEDKKRYAAQQACVKKILVVFEAPGYSDDDTAAATKVVGLMNDMQTYGSPPAELMGPMPAGLETGPDGLPKVPEDCTLM